MKRISFALALLFVGLLTLVPRTMAQGCHIEPMPAATLLLPYFEVDMNNFNGQTTSFSVNNASDQPVLVKAEVWSDMGVAIFGFMIYLKPYDVQTVNMRDIFYSGSLPPTAPPAGTFPSCNGVMPPAAINPGTLFDYQHALTGQSASILGGYCAGRNFHDNVVRGYLTLDTVSSCTTLFQGDSGVFVNGGSGIFTNRNVLWGDYYYTNGNLGQAEGHDLVHILADSTNTATSIPGRYTFYGKFVSWSAADNRVPLATNFGVRVFNSASMTSDLIVWRDPKVSTSPFTCGTFPAWYPLSQARITAFDEDDHAATVISNAFPGVTQRVHVGSFALPMPYSFGWYSLDLNTNVLTAGGVPPADPLAAQAWVTASLLNGSLLTGVDAMRLDSACNARHSGL